MSWPWLSAIGPRIRIANRPLPAKEWTSDYVVLGAQYSALVMQASRMLGGRGKARILAGPTDFDNPARRYNFKVVKSRSSRRGWDIVTGFNLDTYYLFVDSLVDECRRLDVSPLDLIAQRVRELNVPTLSAIRLRGSVSDSSDRRKLKVCC